MITEENQTENLAKIIPLDLLEMTKKVPGITKLIPPEITNKVPVKAKWAGLVRKWQALINGDGYHPEGILVKKSAGKGLGVFATKKFEAGELIELCACINLPEKLVKADRTLLKYSYWSKRAVDETGMVGPSKDPTPMVLLGSGSLYNSCEPDEHPNASYVMFPSFRFGAFVAAVPILPGEEILVWWGMPYWDAFCAPQKRGVAAAQNLIGQKSRELLRASDIEGLYKAISSGE